MILVSEAKTQKLASLTNFITLMFRSIKGLPMAFIVHNCQPTNGLHLINILNLIVDMNIACKSAITKLDSRRLDIRRPHKRAHRPRSPKYMNPFLCHRQDYYVQLLYMSY